MKTSHRTAWTMSPFTHAFDIKYYLTVMFTSMMNILISLLLSICYSFSHRNNIYVLNSFQVLHSVYACVCVCAYVLTYVLK